jgi:hypothetical protein
MPQYQIMKITSIDRLGVAALAVGGSFGVGLPVKSNRLVWVRAPLTGRRVSRPMEKASKS